MHISKALCIEYYSAAHTKDLFELLTKQIDHKSNKKAEFRNQIEKLTAEKLKLEKEFAELETKSEKEEERLRRILRVTTSSGCWCLWRRKSIA
nr:hypothetical protein [Mycoplasmopsis bovis]